MLKEGDTENEINAIKLINFTWVYLIQIITLPEFSNLKCKLICNLVKLINFIVINYKIVLEFILQKINGYAENEHYYKVINYI